MQVSAAPRYDILDRTHKFKDYDGIQDQQGSEETVPIAGYRLLPYFCLNRRKPDLFCRVPINSIAQ